MRARLVVSCTLGIACSSAWAADDPRVQVSATVGYTLADGVTSTTSVVVTAAGTFNGAGPKDTINYGIRFGYMASHKVEVGALFDQQPTKLELTGTTNFTVASMPVRNYHGYVAFNLNESGKTHPYFLIGAGVTQYGTLTRDVNGTTKTIDGHTKFSSTWAAGVKFFPSRPFGLRLEARWTPTYIKSDAAGWWCDPYWGCYAVSNAQYSNQFQFSTGAIFRF